MESRHLLNLSVHNALDCISEHFNQLQFQNFPGGACTRNSLKKCAVRSPDGRYRAHIATVYYISRPPLSQNLPAAPVILFILPFSLTSPPWPKAAASYFNSHTLFHRVKLNLGFLSYFQRGRGEVHIVTVTSIVCFNEVTWTARLGEGKPTRKLYK